MYTENDEFLHALVELGQWQTAECSSPHASVATVGVLYPCYLYSDLKRNTISV
jgi:hypothetical protein